MHHLLNLHISLSSQKTFQRISIIVRNELYNAYGAVSNNTRDRGVTSAPIEALEVKLDAFIGNYDRPTDRLGHKEVSLPVK